MISANTRFSSPKFNKSPEPTLKIPKQKSERVKLVISVRIHISGNTLVCSLDE